MADLTFRDFGYTIYSRFEEALRELISATLRNKYSNPLDGVPSGIVSKTAERSGSLEPQSIDDLLELTDMPDLKEILIFSDTFGQAIAGISKGHLEVLMSHLYDLRCKIAHMRQGFTAVDYGRLIDCTKEMAESMGNFGNQFVDFVMELENNPGRALKVPESFFSDEILPVPNNLPTPDYEYEGGFVGREEDIRKLKELLRGDLHRVITICGAGGVGKTALALRVCNDLAKTVLLDGIVWLSAKETKLSYLGIEDIEPTVKTYEQLLDKIFEVMQFGSPSDELRKKEQDIQTIFDLHKKILIVIDNLETITDERILNFIYDAHPNAKILITSRTGLGQVERRHELKQLKEKEAIFLFRQIAREKKIDSLARVDDLTIKRYVSLLSYYPLAIKWVIGQVAIGKDINRITDSITDQSSDISQFCFAQIYLSISDNARKMLSALSFFDDPASAGVLKYMVDLEQTQFEDGVRELLLTSLIIPEQYKDVSGALSTRYTLLTLTRGYVRRKLDERPHLKRDLEERLRMVQVTNEEAERASRQYRYSLANFGAVTEEEKVAAMIAQTAFTKYQAGRYLEAVEDFKKAVNIAPRLGSVYRNWGVIESEEGHFPDADKLMEKAAKLSPDDPQVWLTWGNLKRKTSRIADSLKMYQRAYELAPEDVVVLNSYGQARLRLGQYDEAVGLFEKALSKGSESDPLFRHQLINITSLANAYCRIGEALLNDRNLAKAEEAFLKGLRYCQKAKELAPDDSIVATQFRKVSLHLGYYYRDAKDLYKSLESFMNATVSRPRRYKDFKDTLTAEIQAVYIMVELDELERAKQQCEKRLLPLSEKFGEPSIIQRVQKLWFIVRRKAGLLLPNADSVDGVIISVARNGNFLVIERSSVPGDTYLGLISNFISPLPFLSPNLAGKRVKFVPTERETDKGLKKLATDIFITS